MSDWIEDIPSAWKGHRAFAEWIVGYLQPETIVELGVDYGYSSFVFANAMKQGTITGIDWFEGDHHTALRKTYDFVLEKKAEHHLDHLVFQKDLFFLASKKWTKPIDILHIDGFHTYEAVSSDYRHWSPHVKEDGIMLFHDTHIPSFGIKDFFRELTGGHKLYFEHSAGLGIFTKNSSLAQTILDTFPNCRNYEKVPF